MIAMSRPPAPSYGQGGGKGADMPPDGGGKGTSVPGTGELKHPGMSQERLNELENHGWKCTHCKTKNLSFRVKGFICDERRVKKTKAELLGLKRGKDGSDPPTFSQRPLQKQREAEEEARECAQVTTHAPMLHARARASHTHTTITTTTTTTNNNKQHITNNKQTTNNKQQ